MPCKVRLILSSRSNVVLLGGPTEKERSDEVLLGEAAKQKRSNVVLLGWSTEKEMANEVLLGVAF